MYVKTCSQTKVTRRRLLKPIATKPRALTPIHPTRQPASQPHLSVRKTQSSPRSVADQRTRPSVPARSLAPQLRGAGTRWTADIDGADAPCPLLWTEGSRCLSARERARRSVRRGGMACAANGGARARRRILCRRAVCTASLQQSAAECSEMQLVVLCGAAVAVARVRHGGDCVATNEWLLGVACWGVLAAAARRRACRDATRVALLPPRPARHSLMAVAAVASQANGGSRRRGFPTPATSRIPSIRSSPSACSQESRFRGREGPRRQLCRSIYVSIAGCCAVARRASRPRHRRCRIHIRPIPSVRSTNPSSCTPRKPRSSSPENADRNVRGVPRTLHPSRRGYTHHVRLETH